MTTPTYPVGHPINPITQLSADPLPHHFTVGRLVPTPIYPVGHPINPITPLSADWSSPKTNRWPTGDHSNVPCWPPHQPHHPSVGRLVITPTYPISRPISPTTPLSADWSSLQCTLSANPLPHHFTVGQLVPTPMYPVGCPINPITPLSADWSSPKTNRWPTGHHPNISRRPPHQPHHPTVGRLVITQTTPSADPLPHYFTVSRLVPTPMYPVG